MIQRRVRDYEVSLWSLQDSLLAILKQYGLEFKGQIQDGKLADKDDGTQEFSFTVPMYLRRNGERIQNPSWYNVQSGALLANMRKIKVIFNKDAENQEDKKIYEFLITKVSQRHEGFESYCDILCEGLAFHELGKIGYKISLSEDDFYNDDYDWYTTGKWKMPNGEYSENQPLATLQYWNDKVFSTISNWTYQVRMNWDSYSLQEYQREGNTTDYYFNNDVIKIIRKRQPDKVYQDNFVDSWTNDEKTGKLIPSHITEAKEKARVNIKIAESNIYNITQTLAELFGVFCRYEYSYDSNYHIINRKVIYYNNFINESNGIIDINYGYDTTSIKREIDSTDLVTKMFVKGVQDNDETGITSIINVEANKSHEDYILNFDYLHDIGGITDEQYEKIQIYINQIRAINQLIDPLSAQIINLQSQLPKLESELTTRTEAIARDTEQIYSTKELLNNLTQNTEILSVTSANPQTAVLLQDTSTSYESYYIKLTQKGIYPQTIQLYRKYDYATAQLSDKITVGQVVFDDAGNVVKVVNLYLGNTNTSKTVYVIYDYKPVLYYERIQAMWSARLAEDTARKAELQQQISRINYSLYGAKSEYKITDVNISSIDIADINLYGRYNKLLEKKQNLIKDFNAEMGPALRQGYWQPQNYNNYGDKYIENLKVGEQYIGQENQFISSSGNAAFRWDTNLFDEEQKLYYEYSAQQQKIAYPCINLLQHPEIMQFIQKNLDKNINFYYKPIASAADNPYARVRPWVVSGPQSITLVPELIKFESGNGYTTVDQDAGYAVSNKVIQHYGTANSAQWRQFTGILNQKIGEGSWKAGYTSFIWQGYNPLTETWVQLTKVVEDKQYENIEQRYSFEVLQQYAPYIRFTHSFNNLGSLTQQQAADIAEIQIRIDQDSIDKFNGWSFRLILSNNHGSNTNINSQWYNSSAGMKKPTKLIILQNDTVITPLDDNLLIVPENNNTKQITLSYNLQNEDSVSYNVYSIEYYFGKSTGNNAITVLTWEQDNEKNINLSTTNSKITVNSSNINQERSQISWNITLSSLEIDVSQLRFRVRAKNIYNYASNVDTLSKVCRVAAVDGTSIYYKSRKIQDYVLINNYSQSEEIIYTLKVQYILFNQSGIFDIINWNKTKNNVSSSIITTNLSVDNDGYLINCEKIMLQPNICKIIMQYQFNNNYIDESINDWDGAQISFNVENDNNEVLIKKQFLLPQPIFDICLPVYIYYNGQYIRIDELNDNNLLKDIRINIIDFLDSNTGTTVNLQIIGRNITEFKWIIIQGDSGNTVNLVVNENNTQNTILSNRYKAIFDSNEYRDRTALTITIPSINDDFSRDQNTVIYCECKNESNNYINESYPQEQQLSFFETNTTDIYISPPFGFYDDQINKILDFYEINWWPNNKNEEKVEKIPIKFYVGNTSNETQARNKLTIESVYGTNIKKLTQSSILKTTDEGFGDEYSVITKNNNNYYLIEDSINNPQITIIGYFQKGKVENKFWIGNLIFKIKPTRDLTDYQGTLSMQNVQLISFPDNPETTNSYPNDKKYGYYFKIISKLDVKDNYKPEEELNIQLTIRQCPPVFNTYYDKNKKQTRNPWAVEPGTGVAHEHSLAPYATEVYYLPMDHPLFKSLIDLNVVKVGNGRNTITSVIQGTGQGKTSRILDTQHQSGLGWQIKFSDFDFNERSVSSYKWGMRYIHCGVRYNNGYPEPSGYQTHPERLFSKDYNYLYANDEHPGESFEEQYLNLINRSNQSIQRDASKPFWNNFFGKNGQSTNPLTIPRLSGRYSTPGLNPGWAFSGYNDPNPCYVQRGINANLYVMAFNKWGRTITKTLGINQLKGYIGRVGYGYQVMRFIRPAALQYYPLYLENNTCTIKELEQYSHQWADYNNFIANGEYNVLLGTDGDSKLGDINYYGNK